MGLFNSSEPKPLSHLITGRHRSNYDEHTDMPSAWLFSHVCDHGRPASSQVRSQQSELAEKGPEPNGNRKHQSGWRARSRDSPTAALFAARTRCGLRLLVEAADSRNRR